MADPDYRREESLEDVAGEEVMEAIEVRRRRAEADARLQSDLRAYEPALLEHREVIRELRDE